VSGIQAIGSGTSRLVQPERTQASMPDIQAALSRAYTRVTGSAPSAATLRTLTAQAAVETGGGGSMYNFNFGGVKGAGPGGLSARCLTHEVIGDKDVVVHQDFRAYASLDEGAVDYVTTMVHRFGGAMQVAATGNLDGFAHALKQAGYYTASESSYASALKCAAAAAPQPSGSGVSIPNAPPILSAADLARLYDALSTSALSIADPAK
jgi:hypothetical protein